MYSLDKLTLCPCAPLYSQNKQHQTEQVAALRLNWIPSFSGLTEIVKALPNSEVQNSPKYDRFGCLKLKKCMCGYCRHNVSSNLNKNADKVIYSAQKLDKTVVSG